MALLIAGCGPSSRGGGGGGGGGSGAMLTSVDVTPAAVTLTTMGGGAAATQQFTATGHFSDGHSEDLTASAGWTVSDPGIGQVLAGAFSGAATRGGVATVYAGKGDISGSATISVKYVAGRVSGDDGSTAGAGSSGVFNNATDDPTLAPMLAYPLDGAIVPHNLGLLEVQWKKPSGAADLYEVSFQAATLDYKVYTNASLPAGFRLSLTPAEWSSISDSTQGQSLTITVRGAVTASPGKAGTSQKVTLNVGAGDVSGGIYYWSPKGSAGSTTGVIMRHSFGDTSGTASQFYAPMSGSSQRCVGCHTITHDGTKMALTYDGGNGGAAIATVPSLSMLLPETSGDKWNFAAYSPDGNRMVASSMGALKILDTSGGAANGTVLQTILDGSAGNYGSHPDWSADGSKIVYVSVGAPNGQSEWSFTKGSIVVVSDMGAGVFGMPTTIVASQGENNYYPAFSPDGKWVLFNRAAGDAYSDAAAETYVVSSDGKIGPIPLGNANSTVANPTNSWPRWNPFVLHEPTGDLMYFTFSSTRDYGIEIVQNPMALQPQVWMAAFDPNGTTDNSNITCSGTPPIPYGAVSGTTREGTKPTPAPASSARTASYDVSASGVDGEGTGSGSGIGRVTSAARFFQALEAGHG